MRASLGRVPPLIAQLGERETVDVADISMSPVRSRVGGLFIRLVPSRYCCIHLIRSTNT